LRWSILLNSLLFCEFLFMMIVFFSENVFQYNHSNLNKSCFTAQWIDDCFIYPLIKALYEWVVVILDGTF
jgi:hypothetical protein